MLKVDSYTIAGKKVGQVELPKEVFGVKPNPVVEAQAVRVFLANQRLGLAHAKTRGEVTSITTAKIYRQKGTGRARHGSKRAPIFVGGGKAHGPTGGQNYKLKLPKQMKRLGLKSALAAKAQEKALWIINDLDKIQKKTQEAAECLKAVLKDKWLKEITLVLDKESVKTTRAFRNLSQVTIRSSASLGIYDILRSQQLILTKRSLEELKDRFVGKKAVRE